MRIVILHLVGKGAVGIETPVRSEPSFQSEISVCT